MPTYVLSSTNSDLGVGGAFNKSLLLTTAGAASQNVQPQGGETLVGRGFTTQGVPGTDGPSGDFTVEVNVTTGDANIQISVQLHRVNSGGTIQNSSSITGEQSATAGVKTFTLTTGLGTWVSGDRLLVDYRFRNPTGAPILITIQQNTTDTEVVTPSRPAPIYFFIPGFLWSGSPKEVPDFLPGTFFTERVSTLKVESLPGSGAGGGGSGTRDRDREEGIGGLPRIGEPGGGPGPF